MKNTGLGQYNIIDPLYDNQLMAVYDLNRLSFSPPEEIIAIQHDKEFCGYVSHILSTYFEQPSEHLQFDLDYLTLTCGFTGRQLKRFEQGLKVGSDHKVKTGKPTRLKNAEPENQYARAYVLKLPYSADTVHIDIRDNNKKKGIRISFIPSVFTIGEFSTIFQIFKRAMGLCDYKAFVKNAKLTRIDNGLNLHGVPYPFLFPMCTDGRVKTNQIDMLAREYPEYGTEYIRENEYWGSLQNSSLRTAYDATLKEIRSVQSSVEQHMGIECFMLELIENMPDDTLHCVSRIEDRYLPNKSSDKVYKIRDLVNIPFRYKQIAILNPTILCKLTKENLHKLNRRGYSHSTGFHKSKESRKKSLAYFDNHKLAINYEELEIMYREHLKLYQKIIAKP